MRRAMRFLLVLTIAAGLMAGQPRPTAAADPGSGLPSITVPPRDPDGPVHLPIGKILPVAPAGAFRPSEMAEALAAHASDPVPFQPGAQPRAMGAATAATTSALALTPDTTSQIGLAPIGGTTTTTALASSLPNGLRKEVLGFLPYWELSASSLQWMRYDRVSTIAFFGVAARSNGSLARRAAG